MSCNDCCWTGRVGEREEEEKIRVSYISRVMIAAGLVVQANEKKKK